MGRNQMERKMRQYFSFLWTPTLLMVSVLLVSACASLTPVPKTSAAEALKSGSYRLDPDHAALLIRVSHFGISDYTGRFNSLSAVLDFDEADPSSARLDMRVEVASLDVNNEKFGQTLTGSDWLDADRYPEARFTIEAVTITGANRGQAAGQLTLQGITKPLILDVVFTGGARNPLTRKYTVGFAASGAFKRSDFGIDALLSFAGDKFDFDTVMLDFNGEFAKE